ncbi:hypothetical protein BDF22DRAFT_671562 [Syncephalis plumigaleata]|nr:hypothetical protein BDF22DRAFT_671562 [Syncephalis plumigaleata]
MHTSSLVVTIGLMGIIALTDVVSVSAVSFRLDANGMQRIAFPNDIVEITVPLANDVDIDRSPIEKVIPMNGFNAGQSKITIKEWVLKSRPTALAEFDGVKMILQCSRNPQDLENEDRMNKLLKSERQLKGKQYGTIFARIPERVISFLLNGKIGCTGYQYEVNAKHFPKFIREYQGPNFKKVWAELSRQLIETVAFLHRIKLVHGDITKNNIFISQIHPKIKPTVILVGFYHMHIGGSNPREIPTEGVSSYVNAKSDAWATGMVIYQAIMYQFFLLYNHSHKALPASEIKESMDKLSRVYGNEKGPKLALRQFGFFPASVYVKLVHATNRLLEVDPKKRLLPGDVVDKLIEINATEKLIWQETFNNIAIDTVNTIERTRKRFSPTRAVQSLRSQASSAFGWI